MDESLDDQLEKYLASYEHLASQIESGIESNRKGNAVLRLLNDQGEPLQDAVIVVRQKSHAFKFGCNILNLGQSGDKNERYEREFAKLFNLATTTFCWSDIEPEPGHLRFAEGSPEIYRRPPPDRVVSFGQKYGIALKGQPLMADTWHPTWATGTIGEIKRLYTGYMEKVAARYGRQFTIWDLVNESLGAAERHPEIPLFTQNLDFVDWAFREARRIFPGDGGLMAINEGGHVNCGPQAIRYYDLVRHLIDQDAGLQAIGFQFHIMPGKNVFNHMNGQLYPLEEVYANYQRFSQLGLPLFITEITVASRFDNWDRTEKDRETGRRVQAEIIRNLYRLWFSISGMAGIIFWNFRDGATFKGEGDCLGCLLDEQFNEKPSYQALHELIHQEWQTNLTLRTDHCGQVEYRGFGGEYEIAVQTCGKTAEYSFSLSEQKENKKTLVWSQGSAK